jgi:hypothetical protein
MTINELFWAAAFGAACGVAGMTALMGILSWAWRRAALWWIARKLRQETLQSFLGYWAPPHPPTPPVLTAAEIKEMVRAMGAPLPGAAAGIRVGTSDDPISAYSKVVGDYDGPARTIGTVAGQGIPPKGELVDPYPGVIATMGLSDGAIAYIVRAAGAPPGVCPCCHSFPGLGALPEPPGGVQEQGKAPEGPPPPAGAS